MTTDTYTFIDAYEGKHTYTDSDCVRFCQWAEEMGFAVRHYQGRYFYEGPGVKLDYIGDAVGVPVRWQSDALGKGVIIYPVARDSGIESF